MHLSIVEISNQIQDVPKTQLDQLTNTYVAIAWTTIAQKRETIRLYQKVEDLNSNSQISKVSGFQNNSQSIIPSLKKFSILLVKMKKFSDNSMKAQHGSVTFCPFSKCWH